MRDTLQPGLTASLSYVVAEDRTVPHLLPEAAEFADMPQVLATGYLVGLVEWTCMRAVNDHLDDSERSVGVHLDLTHEAPTPPHRTVTIDVELTAVDDRKLTFAVRARDDAAEISRGTHQRTVIHLARFEARAHGR
jgi:fluoroacetyl-CoA thioesterase